MSGSLDAAEPYEDWFRFRVPIVFATDTVPFELSAACGRVDLTLVEETGEELERICTMAGASAAPAGTAAKTIRLARNAVYHILTRGSNGTSGERYAFDLVLTNAARQAMGGEPPWSGDSLPWRFWFARPAATGVSEAVDRLGRPSADFPTYVLDREADLFLPIRTNAGAFDELRERGARVGGEPFEVRVLQWLVPRAPPASFVFHGGNLWYAAYPPTTSESTPEQVRALFRSEPRIYVQEHTWRGASARRYTFHAYPEAGIAYVLEGSPPDARFSLKVLAAGGPPDAPEAILWPPPTRADFPVPQSEAEPAGRADDEAQNLAAAPHQHGIVPAHGGSPHEARLRDHYLALARAALERVKEASARSADARRIDLLEAGAATLAVLEWEPHDLETRRLRWQGRDLLDALGAEPADDHPLLERAGTIEDRLTRLANDEAQSPEIGALHSELRRLARRLELTHPDAAERFRQRARELWDVFSLRLSRLPEPCPGCPALEVTALAPGFAKARALGAGDYSVDELREMRDQGYAPVVTGDFDGDGSLDVALIGRGERGGESTLFLLIARRLGGRFEAIHLEPLDWLTAALAVAQDEPHGSLPLILAEYYLPGDDFFYVLWNGRTFDLRYAGEMMDEDGG